MGQPISDPPAGELVRASRERLGISQEELAATSGTTQTVISRLECGRRPPNMAVLARVLHALGLQLTLGVAPLWERIDAELEAAAGRSVDEVFEERALLLYGGGFDLLRVEENLRHIQHCYCGLTAAALLGAPVPVTDCEVLVSGEEALAQFAHWLYRVDALRWDARLGEWGWSDVDPRKPGALRWTTESGVISLQIANVFPRTTTVQFKGVELRVLGLAEVETDDPHVKRLLDRVRMRLASGG